MQKQQKTLAHLPISMDQLTPGTIGLATGRKMNRLIDSWIRLVLILCVAVTILTTIVVIGLLVEEGFLFFKEVSLWDFLTGTKWTPLLEPKSFGVLPLVTGSLMIVFGSMILALPCGLFLSVFLSEIASQKVKSILKPVLEILAGIPTVVFGYFALSFVTPLLRGVFPDIQIFNALAGAIVVGIMILPTIASLCDDAFRSLPTSLKEAGYAMGATRFEVVTGIILPSSKSRISAAAILGVSRAVGETMAVTLAAGANPTMSLDPLKSIQTMTAFIVQVAQGDVQRGGIEYRSIFAVGALLFVITLIMNLIGNRVIYSQKGRL